MLLIGTGNPLRSDDGIGPEIIRRLHNTVRNSSITLIDGGTDSLALLDHMQSYKKPIIIVDAMDMGSPTGTIKVFKPHDISVVVKSDSLSSHGFGLAELMRLMDELRITPDITFIGIQPYSIAFSHGLSTPLSDKMDALLKIIEQVSTCLGYTLY